MLLPVLGSVILAALVLLSRTSPSAAVLAVCALGGLHAHGVVSVPTPGLVRDAAAEVRAVQQRSIARLTCRQVLLAAPHGRSDVVGVSCEAP